MSRWAWSARRLGFGLGIKAMLMAGSRRGRCRAGNAQLAPQQLGPQSQRNRPASAA